MEGTIKIAAETRALALVILLPLVLMFLAGCGGPAGPDDFQSLRGTTIHQAGHNFLTVDAVNDLEQSLENALLSLPVAESSPSQLGKRWDLIAIRACLQNVRVTVREHTWSCEASSTGLCNGQTRGYDVWVGDTGDPRHSAYLHEELHALLYGVTGDLQMDHRGDEWQLAQVQSSGW